MSSNSNNPVRSSCSRQEIRKKESIPADLDQSHLDRYAPRYSGPVSRPLKIQWPSYLPVPGFCTKASTRVVLAAHTRAQIRRRAHGRDGGSLEKRVERVAIREDSQPECLGPRKKKRGSHARGMGWLAKRGARRVAVAHCIASFLSEPAPGTTAQPC